MLRIVTVSSKPCVQKWNCRAGALPGLLKARISQTYLSCLLVLALSVLVSPGDSWGNVGAGSPWFSFTFFPERVPSGFQGAAFCGPGLLQSKSHLSTVRTSHQEKHNSPTLHGCSNLPAVPSRSGKARSLSHPHRLTAVSLHEQAKSLYEFQVDWVLPVTGVPSLTELPPAER